jgi:hypothetical protein
MKFELISEFEGNYDYEKELFRVPDELNTSVDVRLTLLPNNTATIGLFTCNDKGEAATIAEAALPMDNAFRLLINDGIKLPRKYI